MKGCEFAHIRCACFVHKHMVCFLDWLLQANAFDTENFHAIIAFVVIGARPVFVSAARCLIDAYVWSMSCGGCHVVAVLTRTFRMYQSQC